LCGRAGKSLTKSKALLTFQLICSGRVMEFCRLLKRAGFNVTPARIIDAFRSLQYV
jgi:hypothetical protein